MVAASGPPRTASERRLSRLGRASGDGGFHDALRLGDAVALRVIDADFPQLGQYRLVFDKLGDGLFAEIAERDARDRERSVAPLTPAVDAVVVDTTFLTIQEVFEAVLAKAQERGIVPKNKLGVIE